MDITEEIIERMIYIFASECINDVDYAYSRALGEFPEIDEHEVYCIYNRWISDIGGLN